MVDVFCSIAADMCGGECSLVLRRLGTRLGLVEYNIIVCCATVRDRDDIGWFVVYCIQQSWKIGVIGGLWCIIYCNHRAS